LQPAQSAKLAQLLREEKLRGPTDRDPQVPRDDYHYFKGPYILVWDPMHNQKPTMYKEYAKPPTAQEGDWPQFRLTSIGRCPFIYEEDPVPSFPKREQDKVRERGAAQSKEQTVATTTTVFAETEGRPTQRARTGLVEEPADAKEAVQRVVAAAAAARLPPPPATATLRRPSMNGQLFGVPTAASRPHSREPEPKGRFYEIHASGVQRSTSTSAVRSVVQSTGDTSGAAAVMGGQFASREVKNLQRKVLSKHTPAAIRAPPRLEHDANTTGAPSANSVAAANITLHNHGTAGGDTNDGAAGDKKAARTNKKENAKDEANRKMHLCENCNERYERLSEHVMSRRHQKFANDEKNFERLDRLIRTMQRLPRAIDDIDDSHCDSEEVDTTDYN
jgi:regulatory subunit for Cdc7p protein kinase